MKEKERLDVLLQSSEEPPSKRRVGQHQLFSCEGESRLEFQRVSTVFLVVESTAFKA